MNEVDTNGEGSALIYAENEPPLLFDAPHTHACHQRWIKRINRDWFSCQNEEDIPDEWTTDQCGQCRFYIPVTGRLQTDWGVCSNATSSFDGTVRFEHDGCEHYLGADRWAGQYDPPKITDQ